MIRYCTWYSCDECNKPIIGPPVIDPKAGYHPWPAQLPELARTLTARQPRVTYCVDCGDLKRKGMKREKKYKHVDKEIRAVADRIIARIKKKRKQTFDQLKDHYRRKIKFDVIKKAIKVLRWEEQIKKRKGGYIVKKKAADKKGKKASSHSSSKA